MSATLSTTAGILAYDDHGSGPLLVLLPGAGDVRSEHRLLAPRLVAAGYRVVTADLRGHGDTSPHWASYGVAETSGDVMALIRHLDAGPAVVIANSFAPAAALWAAADHPELVRAIVAISPHIDEGGSLMQRLALDVVMRGPWAGPAWAKLYRGWYKGRVPEDLDGEIAALRTMLRDPQRRRAVRQTLVADRSGLEAKLTELDVPVLAIFGGADDHFAEPAGAAAHVADITHGSFAMVEGAGHYPHVEQPDEVAQLINHFLEQL